MPQHNDGAVVARNVTYDVRNGEFVKHFAQRGYRHSELVAEILFVYRHSVGKDSRIVPHKCLQQTDLRRVSQFDFVEPRTVGHYLHAGRDVHILAVDYMPRSFEIMQGVVNARTAQTEAFAEFFNREFEFASDSSLIGYAVEDMKFLVYVFDIGQRRETRTFELAQTVRVLRIPQQHHIGAFPVPSGAPGFLEIRFRRVRQVAVDNEPYVRFVYAHAECVRAHHHPRAACLPRFLTGIASGA